MNRRRRVLTAFGAATLARSERDLCAAGEAAPNRRPAEQPTRFDLIVNLKTTEALGVTIPQTVLVYADRVID